MPFIQITSLFSVVPAFFIHQQALLFREIKSSKQHIMQLGTFIVICNSGNIAKRYNPKHYSNESKRLFSS